MAHLLLAMQMGSLGKLGRLQQAPSCPSPAEIDDPSVTVLQQCMAEQVGAHPCRTGLGYATAGGSLLSRQYLRPAHKTPSSDLACTLALNVATLSGHAPAVNG